MNEKTLAERVNEAIKLGTMIQLTEKDKARIQEEYSRRVTPTLRQIKKEELVGYSKILSYSFIVD